MIIYISTHIIMMRVEIKIKNGIDKVFLTKDFHPQILNDELDYVKIFLHYFNILNPLYNKLK